MHKVMFPALRMAQTEASPTFNVVLVYEDLETGKRAMRTYDYLVDQLGQDCLFANQMWKFDLLAVSKLREIAARDAAAADIVIVSAHEGRELSYEVKDWVEMWATQETKTIAVVGLFDSEPSLVTPVRDFLEQTAERLGIQFFSQPGLWPDEISAVGAIRQEPVTAEPRQEKTFSILANMVQDQPAISHWGINE